MEKRFWAKRAWWLCRYYGRTFSRRAAGYWAWAMFFLAFGIFGWNVVASGIWGAMPGARKMTLAGVVVEGPSDTARTGPPVSGARVIVGGFEALTGDNGEFALKFVSMRADSVPLLILHSGRWSVLTVTFPTDRRALDTVLVVR